MDFFAAQDAARRNTGRLVVLFMIAVGAIVAAVYLVIALVAHFSFTETASQDFTWWRPELFWPAALGTALVVSGGTLFRMWQLARGGGAAVAESLGGRRVSRSTTDRAEQRLLNVVDEMAIASGVQAPQIYVLEQEHGINAFAAGITPNRAVVAVTRGALDQLNRDELQGVVAHEFSHIGNGDMRLNLRLIGVLHGILLIALAGRGMLRGMGRSRGRSAGGAVMLGLGLLVVGYIGVLFGRVIKAAVSRQREYLADAAAVQFTRNPAGIAGALNKIARGGSLIEHPKAEEASHAYFGQGLALTRLWATHPPIEERIRRIDPMFAQELARPHHAEPATTAPDSISGFSSMDPAFAGAAPSSRVVATPARIRASVGSLDVRSLAYANQLIRDLPEPLYRMAHHPEGARVLLFALLLAHDGTEAALAAIPPDCRTEVAEAAPELARLGTAYRLPLIELALPTLQELAPEKSARFLAELEAICRADQRLSLFEFVLMAVVRAALEPQRGRGAGKYRVPELQSAVMHLLSLFAHAGHREPDQAKTAFDAAAKLAPLAPGVLLDRDRLSLKQVINGLERLARTNYRFRGKLIEACTAAVTSDNRVAVQEAELLRAVGARLDCPIPPLTADVSPSR